MEPREASLAMTSLHVARGRRVIDDAGCDRPPAFRTFRWGRQEPAGTRSWGKWILVAVTTVSTTVGGAYVGILILAALAILALGAGVGYEAGGVLTGVLGLCIALAVLAAVAALKVLADIAADKFDTFLNGERPQVTVSGPSGSYAHRIVECQDTPGFTYCLATDRRLLILTRRWRDPAGQRPAPEHRLATVLELPRSAVTGMEARGAGLLPGRLVTIRFIDGSLVVLRVSGRKAAESLVGALASGH